MRFFFAPLCALVLATLVVALPILEERKDGYGHYADYKRDMTLEERKDGYGHYADYKREQ
jgi:hypothetical protein